MRKQTQRHKTAAAGTPYCIKPYGHRYFAVREFRTDKLITVCVYLRGATTLVQHMKDTATKEQR